MAPLKPTPLPDLREVFEPYADIMAVYLFGSYARGTAQAHSDLDLAIYSKTQSTEHRIGILTQLTSLGFDRIDLVYCHQVDLVTLFEVVKTNCLIFTRPEFQSTAYYSLILRMYFDMQPVYEYQRRKMKERLQNGQS